MHYPVKSLDIVEISPEVVEASDIFIPWNNNVLADPRTNLILQDGRAHLQLTDRRYDVIISEPSNPWMAGMASLFTHEFFTLAKERLNEEGIFLQWFHAYKLDWATFALVGRTFADVFPHSIFLKASPSAHVLDYLLVGFKGEKGLSLDIAQKNLMYAQKSHNVVIPDPGILYRLILGEDLPALFGKGIVNTDNCPKLEFAAPRFMYYSDPNILQKIQSNKYLSRQTQDIVSHITSDIDSRIDFASYALSVYSPFTNMVDPERATPAQKERYFTLMEEYFMENPLEDPSVLNSDELMRKCIFNQMQVIQHNIEEMPDKASSYKYLAMLFYNQNMLGAAAQNLTRALQIEPDDADAHYHLGLIYHLQNRFDKAEQQYRLALNLKSDNVNVLNNLGVLLELQGKFDEAGIYYRRADNITPR